MTICNNAAIEFNAIIPDEAMEKLAEYEECTFGKTWHPDGSSVSTLEYEEVYGDLVSDLNEIVEILKPYGVTPLIGEYNRYYGDYDGYDVFTGEKFESMDDVEYGRWALSNTIITAKTEYRDYLEKSLQETNDRLENAKGVNDFRRMAYFEGKIDGLKAALEAMPKE